jgi:hypothetical protein
MVRRVFADNAIIALDKVAPHLVGITTQARVVLAQKSSIDEPNVYAALKKLSADTGAPMAFYLRKAVEKVLAEHGVRVGRAKEK